MSWEKRMHKMVMKRIPIRFQSWGEGGFINKRMVSKKSQVLLPICCFSCWSGWGCLDKANKITGAATTDIISWLSTQWQARVYEHWRRLPKNTTLLRMLDLWPNRELVSALLEQVRILRVDQKSLEILAAFCQWTLSRQDAYTDIIWITVWIMVAL